MPCRYNPITSQAGRFLLFYSLKNYCLRYFRISVRILLVFQLCLASSPIYANPEKPEEDSSLSQTIDEAVFQIDMIKHINNGTIDEFLQGHREKLARNQEDYKQKFDYFRLSGQVIHLIDHVAKKTEEGSRRVTERIRDRINMDTPDIHLFSKPIRKMSLHQPEKELLKELENTQYPEEKEGWAFLEGISNQQVQVRHYFPDLKIKAQAENDLFIAFLDSKKGLILIYKPYAQTYIGKAPIPLISLSSGFYPNSPETWSREKKDQLSLEFTSSKDFKPFDSIARKAFFHEDSSLESNFEGRKRFSEGGLALVRTTPEGKRHLLKYAGKRTMMDRTAYTYQAVALMVTAEDSVDHLNNLESNKEFNREIQRFVEQGKEFLSLNISSVLLRQTIHRLAAVHAGIQYVINRCKVTQCRMFVEPEKQSVDENAEKIRKTAGALSRIKSKTFKTLTHPLTLSAGILVFVNALWPSLIPTLLETGVGSISSIASKNADSFAQGGAYYVDTMLEHALTAGVFVFAGLWLFGVGLYKGPKAAAGLLASNQWTKNLKMTAHLKDMAERIEKEREETPHRSMPLRMLIKLSMRLNAVLLQPAWVYFMKYVFGQPVFVHAYKQGLHPTAQVRDSKGRLLHLGWMKPTWLNKIHSSLGSSSEDIEERYKLQHTAVEKQKRIRNAAFILSAIAVSNPSKLGSDLMLGAYNIRKELERIYSDPALQKKHDWIFVMLSKDMMSEIDLINLDKIADIKTRIWDHYYDKALLYAQDYKPSKGTQLRKWLAQEPMFRFWSGFFTVNSDMVHLFKSQPSEFIESRVLKEIVTDQITVLFFPFLAGERNESFHLEKGHIAAGDPSGPLHGGGAHSNEAMQNLGVQATANIGMNVLVWGEESRRIDEFAKKASNEYQPQLDNMTTHKQSALDYIKRAKRAHPEHELFSLGYEREQSIAVKMFQFWIVFMVLTRTLMADQTLGTAFLASLIFIAARPWIYAWVWTPVQLFARKNGEFIERNKKIMRNLQINFLDIYNKNFEEESQLRSAYKKSVRDIVELYKNKPKLFQYLKSQFAEALEEDSQLRQVFQAGHDYDSLENESIENIEKNSRIFSNMLAQKPPLPNKESAFDWWQTFWLGAVGSTVLFIEFLSIPTYDDSMVTLANLGGALGIFGAYMLIAKKWGERRQNSHLRQIKASVWPEAPPKEIRWTRRIQNHTAVQKTVSFCQRVFQGE